MIGYTVIGSGEAGGLRFEQRSRATTTVSLQEDDGYAVLLDGDEAIVDCEAWDTSRITPVEHGALLLLVGRNAYDRLFRIDPAAHSFREHGVADAPVYPLDRLTEALEAARALPPPPYSYRRLAPDGSLAIELAAVEWSNSHWVHSPRVVEIATGRVLLDLWNTDWDATVFFPGPDQAAFNLRTYRTGVQLTLRTDLATDSFTIVQPSDQAQPASAAPIAELPARLALVVEHAMRQAAGSRPGGARVPPSRAGIGTILLIILGAAAAIAVGTWISLTLHPERKQALTPLPDFADLHNDTAPPRLPAEYRPR